GDRMWDWDVRAVFLGQSQTGPTPASRYWEKRFPGMDCGGRPSAIGRAAHESLCVELLPVTKRISGWHSACKGPRTTRTTMTTCLKLTALFSLAALSSAAAAESAGLPIPSFAT